jgi:hypothetical protein
MSEPRPLPSHQAVTFSSFMNEFVGESDRAAVILGASKVEYLLGEILDKFLLPTPSANDDLLEGDSPIGTFSAKIKLCHRLGIIDDHFAKLLNTFRKLRNGFAHEVTSNSLNTGSARDRVAALAEPFAGTELFQSLLGKVATQMNRAQSDHGAIFRTVLAVFHIHLMGIHHGLAPTQRQAMQTVRDLCRNTKIPATPPSEAAPTK